MSAIYGLGAAIHFTPREVDEMSLWELAACVDGFNQVHGPPPDRPPHMTAEECDEMLARHLEIIKFTPATKASNNGSAASDPG